MTSPDAQPVTFYVAGVKFRPESIRTSILDELLARHPDCTTFPITLSGEPSNPYDRRAVKVMAGGQHLGYVPKPTNAFIYALRDAGTKPVARLVSYNPCAETHKMFQVEVTFIKS